MFALQSTDNHYILLNRLNNLDSAAVFESVDESDVEYVQNFIRTILHDILLPKSKEIGFKYDENEYYHFFGQFAEDRTQFTFSECDKLIIKLLVTHIEFVLREKDGLNHFSTDSTFEGVQTGHFFRDQSPATKTETCQKQETIDIIPDRATQTHAFLNKLMITADRNASKCKAGYRYSNEIRKLSSYLRIICGRLAYQTIQSNIPLALPTLSSTNRYITHGHGRAVEGQLRIQELSNYLSQRNLPRIVALSEDATRINGVPQYDSKSNEILGFVLPLSGNGMPIPHSYPAKNFDEIYTYFRNGMPCAHFLNVIMAQPMANVPPFCVLIFCSNSKYKAEDVAHRWEFITKELEKADIRVLAISSDSDPKYNSAMRKCTQLGIQSNIFEGCEWFCMGAYEQLIEFRKVEQPYYIQDTVHIATKLRNMFLKTMRNQKMLPFGPNFYIQTNHIEFLIRNFSKDRHRLTANVLNREDKQNFESVLRICDPTVINLLKTNVPGSRATASFLQLLRDVIDAYRDVKLTPLQRIEKIWFAVFVLRIWRDYVSSSKHLSIQKNFLTSYCYSCIELNAHGLVLVMLDLGNTNSHSSFQPNLLESQPCEAMFRQLRSMSTVYSTVTNCTLREVLDRLNRIELQSEIAATTNFVFPRIKSTDSAPFVDCELPTKDNICNQIEQCKKNAITFAISIGLMKKNQKSKIDLKCEISPLTFKTTTSDDVNYNESTQDHSIRNMKLIQFETLTLKNYTEKFVDTFVPEKSHFVEVPGFRNRKIIKKSSLVWLLRADSVKLSSDRLLRVRALFPRKLKGKTICLKRKQKINHFNFR